MDGMEPRLRIELVPGPLWRQNLRTILRDSEWQRLRRWALDRAGNACEACGHHVEGGKNLVCHEQWSYDEQAGTQTLTGVEIHCRDCDAVTHIGNTEIHGGLIGLGKALRRLADMNGWTPQQSMAHFQEARETFKRRSGLTWAQDIGWYRRWLAKAGPGS